MEGQTDKINYRRDVINVQQFLKIMKPLWYMNNKYFQCLLCMTDRLTDKVNYTLDAHWYSPKISTVLSSIAAEKISFPPKRYGQTAEQTQ